MQDTCKRVFSEMPSPRNDVWYAEARLGLGFALSLEGLLAEVSFDLLPENQHAQVRVGGLVHGFGLDAHAVLLRRQLVRALLLVPQVEESRHRSPDHDHVAAEILPVKMDVFHTPTFHLKIETTDV